MKAYSTWIASGLLALCTAMPAAAITVYTTTLSGAAESPPNASPATGTAKITIDGIMMRVEASFSGLLGTTTAAHIHCCTAVADTGTAGVATQTPTFSGFPSGVTSGTYDTTFDMSLDSSFNASFVTAHGGTAASAFSFLVAGMDAGQSYFNIHSTLYPGGEIRGFLHAVPEPETYALMLLGLAAVAAVARRRRQH